jgi:protein TonB
MLSGVIGISLSIYLLTEHQTVPNLDSLLTERDSIYVIPFKSLPPEPPPPADPVPASAPRQLSSGAATATLVSDSAATETVTTVSGPSTLSASVTGTTAVKANSSTAAITSTVAQPRRLYELDEPAAFEGGFSALLRFLGKNIRYPEIAREFSISGTVHMSFVVDELGQISDVKALNHPGYGMEEEAIRVIRLIPGFKSPARVNGVAVKSYYELPVRFSIK